MQTITLYGFGYVGKAVARFLGDHYKLQLVDPALDPSAVVTADEMGIREFTLRKTWRTAEPTDLAVVCVPTPPKQNGACDTSIVEDIVAHAPHTHFLIKSTVVPGTTVKLAAQFPDKTIVFSPEYIGEGKYEIPFWKDLPHPTNMKLHTFHIFGGPRKATEPWVRAWSKVAGWTPEYCQTDSTTAELVKYAENMFLGTKKLFCSELYLTAKAFGVDYNELKELWLKDGRVGRSMTLIWPEKLAYGGKCLPKDTGAIVQASTRAGHDPKLFRAVVARNKELARKDARKRK